VPRQTGITLAVLLAAACAGGPTHPHANQTWALNTVDGQALPALVQFGPGTFTIVADSIQFIGDNDWRRSQAYVENVPNNPELQRLITSSGFVTLRDGDILLDFQCDDIGDCPPVAILRPQGNTLVLADQMLPPTENLVYHQVR
jgi:hypothetical protein